MPAARVLSAKEPTVHRTIFSSGQLALYTTAAGVSGVYAPCKSAVCTLSISPMDRKITMVAPCAARLASFSRSGTGVRPSMRVMMTVWLTVGRVYSAFSAAAAPQKLETPGVSS